MESHQGRVFVMKSNLFSVFITCMFGVLAKKPLHNQRLQRFIPVFFSFVATSFFFYVSLTFSYLELSSVHAYLSFYSCFPLCFHVFGPFVFYLASWLLMLSAIPTNHLITCSLLLACCLFMLPPRVLHSSPLFILELPALMWHFPCLPVVKELLSFQVVFFRGNCSI